MSVLASSGLAYVTYRQLRTSTVIAWWAVFTTLLLLRAVDTFQFWTGPPLRVRKPHREFFWFAAGAITTAIFWAIYTLLFLKPMNEAGRTTAIIVLCGMVGGGATVFAPSRLISSVFCSLLALPAALLFFTLPGPQNLFLGILGCAFFVVMLSSSHISHQAVMRAIRLRRANELLVSDMRAERRKTDEVNQELQTAQDALRDANKLLEFRIRLRTADLEREVREKEIYASRLTVLASTDPLTGLLNRATLAGQLGTAVAAAQQSGAMLSVLFLDLDRFKEVNDAMGHITGDRVLRAIASRLSLRFPELKIARWGGDEFVTFLPNVGDNFEVLAVADSLLACMSPPIEIDHRHVTVKATIGVALYPQHARTQEELIWAADVAMFAGKVGRQSHVRMFDAELSQRLLQRRQLEEALRSAVANRALSLVFQPVVDVRRRRCEAMETLIRWQHPQLGPISPSEFIPLAESTGEIIEIGRWVLHQACHEAAAWPGRDAPAVSVNISAVQIEAGTIVADVLNALDESKLPPHRLHLELTESLFAAEESPVVSVLTELRAKGIHILLDDFGTGFSCLAYLRRLPVDRLKIDQAFVADLHRDAGPIVESIVTTSRAFNLELVAEGVETAAQAHTLEAMGVHYLQGHFISGAMPPQAARDWLIAQGRTPLRRAQTV